MRKVWLMPTAPEPCSNIAKTAETQDLDTKWILHPAEFRYGGKSPRKRMCNIPAKQMAKHRAKFGELLLSDITAVMKRIREPH